MSVPHGLSNHDAIYVSSKSSSDPSPLPTKGPQAASYPYTTFAGLVPRLVHQQSVTLDLPNTSLLIPPIQRPE